MLLNQEKIITWLTCFFAEILATATLVFLGCLGCVDNFPGFHPTHLTICLCFGLAVMMSLNIFGCVSGAHINPIVTLAGLFYKLVDVPVSILTICQQKVHKIFIILIRLQ